MKMNETDEKLIYRRLHKAEHKELQVGKDTHWKEEHSHRNYCNKEELRESCLAGVVRPW